MAQPLFITLEGGEGAGKSTLTKGLVQKLQAHGRTCDPTREPGGTENAEALRNLLVEGDKNRWQAWSEALILYAARHDHVERRIKPALAAGQDVICDRFTDSTFAYQGAAGQLDADRLNQLNTLCMQGFKPDITFILDLDPALGLERTYQRGEGVTRFEAQELSFHQSLRQAFLDIAAAEPERCIVLDAAQSPDQVLDTAWRALNARLALTP